MATPTSVRLPDDLDARLSAYCTMRGAVRNRVIAIALRDYLDGAAVHAPPPVYPRHEPRDDETESAQ